MALYYSSVFFNPALISAIQPSNTPLLLTPVRILRFRHSKPFSQFTLAKHPRASPPHKYTYPDPIPEFAVAETQKFRSELLRKLLKDKDTFGDNLNEVIDVCTEIFSEFLHKEYGGPGTLLVEPFTNMLVALKQKQLPGAPLAARASLLWAQNYVDQDWEVWNSNLPN
ncbi:hypothetical protein I3760_05G150500 [Carya illinoinensis]|uniref:Uncharacterized protein n=1 Tax=Carya illinoinensis TaxID=32201 RepID=A0A922F382_CARIL|nr:hypothetical protein I3760_05G150500 [Carya illinoinensis]KAG6713350.1 hypothetical protein I3842_05G147100 [Carya illinoinensis]